MKYLFISLLILCNFTSCETIGNKTHYLNVEINGIDYDSLFVFRSVEQPKTIRNIQA